MRTMNRAAVAIAAVGMAACAHGIGVHTDHDPSVNVADYVTFFMPDGHSSGNPSTDQRIKSDIASALTDIGWIETSPEDGEAVVVAHVSTT
jgi:hypothetical protein